MPNTNTEPFQSETALDWEDAVQLLREEFRRGAAERLVDLRSQLVRLGDVPSDREALERACRHFHVLSGSAGSFGFAETSDASHEGEKLCLRLLSQTLGVSTASLARLRDVEGTITSSLGLTG